MRDFDFDAELDEVLSEHHADGQHDPTRLEDAHLAATVAERALAGRFCWAQGMGWQRYRGGCWVAVTDAAVCDEVRRDVIAQHRREAVAGTNVDRLRRLSGMLSASRIRALVTLARGIVEVDAADFDQHHDLLNVGNGVVDLRTGTLTAHDPELMLTKITDVRYVPGATSTDWTAALAALSAEVVIWMQARFGQAATGHATPDDVMPVLQGSGSNGKTTITGAVARALGGHAVAVPERVLLANPSDHPTELMTLRGARLALIEETPEARHLNVQRLKATCGTPTMTARLIGRDNVTWTATHSLMLTSNYVPRVDETDHGTWRRLALVKFPYTFTTKIKTPTANLRPAVDGLRERLRDGRRGEHEAVLAWIVAGARRWYDADRVLPPAPALVEADTAGWRAEADLVYGYIRDRLVLERDFHVVATELYRDFVEWIEQRGHKPWADQTLTARFGTHAMIEAAHVVKSRTRGTTGQVSRKVGYLNPAPTQYQAWHGIRFRVDRDDADELADGPDHGKNGRVQGVQGWLGGPREIGDPARTGVPLHSLHSELVRAVRPW